MSIYWYQSWRSPVCQGEILTPFTSIKYIIHLRFFCVCRLALFLSQFFLYKCCLIFGCFHKVVPMSAYVPCNIFIPSLVSSCGNFLHRSPLDQQTWTYTITGVLVQSKYKLQPCWLVDLLGLHFFLFHHHQISKDFLLRISTSCCSKRTHLAATASVLSSSAANIPDGDSTLQSD